MILEMSSGCKIKNIVTKERKKDLEPVNNNTAEPVKHGFSGWSSCQERVIIENYGELTVEELANMVGKSKSAVIAKVRKLRDNGIIARKNHTWNIDDTLVKDLVFSGYTNDEIVDIISVPLHSVKTAIKRLVNSGEIPDREPRNIIRRSFNILANYGYSREESLKIMGVKK